MKRKFTFGDFVLHAMLAVLAFFAIFPFYYVLIVSFADPAQFLKRLLYILPYGFDFSSYAILFMENSMFNAFGVSLFVTLTGAVLSMTLTTTASYALSKKQTPLRMVVLYMILFTMFFSGQLIPYYVLIKSLGMRNSLTVMIIPAALNTFYLIILKNYFLTVPKSLEESAKIDGANDITVLFRILVPISLPILASITLFYSVDKWNDWWMAMLFLDDKKLWPLQMVLKDLIANISASSHSPIGKLMAVKFKRMNPQSVKMAAVIVTCVPIFIVYPFLQKYFTKGIMIGSIKE